MTVTVSPNGTNLFETTMASEEVLVGTADGVVALQRSGSGWVEARRSLQGKHVGCLTIDAQTGTVFAGTHKSGLWASEDDGNTWQQRDNGIPFDNFYGLNCVVVGSETRLYAGTEPAHLFFSKDLGRSWTELTALRDVPSLKDWTFPGPPHEAHVKNIMFDPRDPNTIYVGIEVGGAFKSTDGGKTFKELNEGGFYEDVHRLMISPSRPDELWMSTGRGLYRSPDAGTTWTLRPLPGVNREENYANNDGISYPDALVILPDKPEVMFTAGASSSPPGWSRNEGAYARVGRSRDGGETWQYLGGGLPKDARANIEAMTLNTYPGGFQLFAGTTDGEVLFSDDEGENWQTIAKSLAPVSKGGHYRSVNPEYAAAHSSGGGRGVQGAPITERGGH